MSALFARQPKTHPAILSLLGYIALTVVWLRPLPWQLATHLTQPLGDPAITAWRLVWPAQWLVQRPAPFLDTNVLYPSVNVFVRDELTLGGSLIAGPVYLLTQNAVLAYNITVLCTFIFTAFCTYLLVTTWTALPSVGFLAGCIVTFAPYRMAQIGHVGLLSVEWLPLLLLSIDRLVVTGRKRWAAVLALSAVMQTLSAGYYGYLVALTIGVFLVVILLLRRTFLSRRVGFLIGISLVGAFLVVLPILLPFQQVAAREHFVRSLTEVEFWSARPQSYLAATPNNLIYGALVRRAVWTNWVSEAYLFPGILPVILAIIGVARGQTWRRWFALTLSAVALLLSLGPRLHLAQRDIGLFPLPYLLAYRSIPGISGLRVPLRIAPLVMLGVALLAAWGAQYLWSRSVRIRGNQPALGRFVVLGLAGCILVEFFAAPLATTPVPPASPVRRWLTDRPPAVVCELPYPQTPLQMLHATYGQDRYVNGTAEIMAPAQRELFNLLRHVADQTKNAQEAFQVLQAIGVDYLALHRNRFSPVQWAALQTALNDADSPVQYQATRGDAAIFQFIPAQERYQSLLAAIPVGSQVFVSSGKETRGNVLGKAVIMHLLADRTIVSTLYTGWAPVPISPQPNDRYQFGVFYPGEIVPAAWNTSDLVWSDRTVVIYRAQMNGNEQSG